MARITMRNVQKSPVEQYFGLFLSSAAARGVKDKILQTYKQHFHSISKRMDVTVPMNCLNAQDLDNMILKMREEGLSDCSINSYTRTLKVFFSWCNEEGHSDLNIKLYKAAETVKEVYTDDELLILLKKPEANCNFCEYRNWTIINFLLNSGCRAATVRNILNQDVDLARKQIVLRHTENGKVQVIPLCSSMVAILRDYMAIRAGGGSDYLFCNEFGDLLTENAFTGLICFNSNLPIASINELDAVKVFLEGNAEFRQKDATGHHMYSVAFKHFYRFACEDNSFFSNSISTMDIVIAKPKTITTSSIQWRRNQIIITQAIEGAKYQCEHNPAHMTFIARSTGQAYMEGHHLIPMKYQSQFDCGIDVYANVVCLCPTCHRLLHFGRDPERCYAVEQLFDLRSERLIHSGIDLSKKDFLELVLA